jgi:carbon monoxide dehydrogenase subunit G
MQLGSSFRVPADPVTVFEKFLDAPTMQSCIPGCEELVRTDETHFSGRLVNTIAHVRFNAAFSAEIVEMDPPREVRAVLQGEDMRLGSSLKLNATLTVRPDGDGSEVTYAMEMALWGKLGRMGESIFRRRTAEVEKQFVVAFSEACTTGVPAVVGTSPVEEAPAAASPELTTARAPAPTPTEIRPVPAQVPAAPAPAGFWRRLALRVRRLFSGRGH